MKQFAIIADDLTGAGDTGVQFARFGIPTRVVFGDWQKDNFHGTVVAAVNTDTRALSEKEAYSIVRKVTARLIDYSIIPLFKKIDSTLRGNIAVEIDAVADETGAEAVIFSPAFPENGRTVVNGILLVNGIPVSRTPMGMDPGNPIKQSNIPELLGDSTKRKIRLVSFDEIAKGVSFTEGIFTAESASGSTVFVCDAVTSDDLETVTEAAFSSRKKILFAGAAGLGRMVAKHLAAKEAETGKVFSMQERKVLALVGSVNPVAREQLKALKNSGSWLSIEIPVEILVSDEPDYKAWIEDKIIQLKSKIAGSPGLIIHSEGSPVSVKTALSEALKKGIDHRSATVNFAGIIAGAGMSFLLTGMFDGVIATGGDIARALLDMAGATGLDVIREVSPGIPLGVIPDGKLKGLPIVTKAGGFGKTDAFVASAEMLRDYN